MPNDTVYHDDREMVDEYHILAWAAYEQIERGEDAGAEERKQCVDEIIAYSLATIATIMYRKWKDEGRP